MYSKEQIEKAVKSQGYVWFDGAKDYDVNIVGVRNATPGQKVTNLFEDKLTLSYKINFMFVLSTYVNNNKMIKNKFKRNKFSVVPLLTKGEKLAKRIYQLSFFTEKKLMD